MTGRVRKRRMESAATGFVSLDLCPLPLAAGFWGAEVRAILMAVPEAAVIEDDVKKCPVVAFGYAGQAE